MDRQSNGATSRSLKYAFLFLVPGLCICLAIWLAACSLRSDSELSYTHISQDEAMEMMEKNDGHIIVDVRKQDEYDEGHIPGAVLIPNDSIKDEPPEALPDKDQIILIYCRSGIRAKKAAKKLADMGYTNIYEFGGIKKWKGEIVTE